MIESCKDEVILELDLEGWVALCRLKWEKGNPKQRKKYKQIYKASLVAQRLKHLPPVRETRV